MYLEKEFKREDGTKYQIRVSVWLDHSSAKYDIDQVYKKEPKQKKWRPVYLFDYDYSWRCLNIKERKDACIKKYLEFVSESELEETLLELWNNLRPTKFFNSN